jgi:hypothetical protein
VFAEVLTPNGFVLEVEVCCGIEAVVAVESLYRM